MITKIERGVEAETNTFSITSEEIAKRLLQGWTMLDSVCSICHETPLLKQKNVPHRFCARCNVFIKIESAEDVTSSSASTAVEETKKENKEESEKEKEQEQKQEQEQNELKEYVKNERDNEENKIEKEMEDYSGHGIYRKEVESNDHKENEPNEIDLYGRINSSIKYRNNHFFTGYKNVAENANNNNDKNKERAKYIKEIKLQTGEFEEFMNNCTIPQMETTTLMDLNKYINKKCGNCFTDYLNFENEKQYVEDDVEEVVVEKEEEEEEEEKEEKEIGERDKDEQDGVEMKIESDDNELRIRRYSYKGNIISNCKKLENEIFIFEKVRYALMTILEKYAEELIVNSKKNHDVELITKMTQVTTLLEKISNLSKTLKI